MPPRRAQQQQQQQQALQQFPVPHNLSIPSPSDTLSPPAISPNHAQQPRSASPSSGFTNFLSKPSKWFSRSASASKVPTSVYSDARPSMSSTIGGGPPGNANPGNVVGGRKHKISRPTDPRPILDGYAGAAGSRSVLDLSSRTQNSVEIGRFQHAPSTPSSPNNHFNPHQPHPYPHPPASPGSAHTANPQYAAQLQQSPRSRPPIPSPIHTSTSTSPYMHGNPSGGLGDLRNMSRKPWSRSADDLSKMKAQPHFSPVQASFMQDKIAEYRGRSNSSASGAALTSSPTNASPGPAFQRVVGAPPGNIPPNANGNGNVQVHPFPSLGTTPPGPSTFSSASNPHQQRSATLPSVSVSAPGPSIPHGLNTSTSSSTSGSGVTSPSESSLNTSLSASSKNTSPTHNHTRSHSFTPKLPSKLNTPRYPQQLESPQRSGSGSSGIDPASAPGNLNQGPGQFVFAQQNPTLGGTPTRAAFGFGFGPAPNNSPSLAAANRQTTVLLPPPTIIEPGHTSPGPRSGRQQPQNMHLHQEHGDLEVDSKRASQIVFQSGFINRLVEIPPSLLGMLTHTLSGHGHGQSHSGAGHLSMNPNALNALSTHKGWKGYKVELKGPKLYFYKPPSDKATGIKELFPTGLVPPSEEEPDLEGVDEAGEGSGVDDGEGGGSVRARKASGNLSGMAGTGGRKKRAFWGRRQHPDLVLKKSANGEDSVVEKGTWEALAHETVFGASFGMLDGEEAGEETGDDVPEWKKEERRKERVRAYARFATSMLLALPELVGPAAFEAEFTRCCSYLVGGASDKSSSDDNEVSPPPNEGEEGSGDHEEAQAKVDDESKEKEEEKEGSQVKTRTEKDRMKSRVAWLVQCYLSFHLRPVDRTAWDAALDEILVDAVSDSELDASIVITEEPSRITESPEESEQPVPTPPIPASVNLPFNLRDVLNVGGLTRDVLMMLDPTAVARSLTIFHADVMVQESSRSTEASTASKPGNFGLQWLLNSGTSPNQYAETDDTINDSATVAPTSAFPVPFFGSDDRPHWLTKLVLLQIFGAADNGYAQQMQLQMQMSMQTSPNGRRRSEDRGHHHPPIPHQTSRTHTRSELISVWARIAEQCRVAGDECTFRAICAALCSRPVARLDKAWKRVDSRTWSVVQGWVAALGGESDSEREMKEGDMQEEGEGHGKHDNGTTVSSKAGPATPWGGDIPGRLQELFARAKKTDSGDVSTMISVEPLAQAKGLFDQFRRTFERCSVAAKEVVGLAQEREDIKVLTAFWREVVQDETASGMGSLSVKFQRIDQFMSLSLAAEPRRKGLFEPYFWSRTASSNTSPTSSSQTSAIQTSLLPLLFPEPLPTVTLIERSKLVRGRIDSDASADLQYLRSLDAQLRQEAAAFGKNGQQSQLHRFGDNMVQAQDFTRRAIMGQGGTVISVHDGDLLLVVQSGGFESAPNSRPNSKVVSRPPSSSVDQHGNLIGGSGERPSMNRTPSIRAKPSSSHTLDRKTSMARRSSLPSVSHLNRQNFVTSEPSSEPPLRVVVQAGTLNRLVDILVHGLESITVSVADDNGEISLREGMMRELVVDRVEFARVWWNVFRSFVTPLVFFELLRKIFITSQPSGSSPSVDDYQQSVSKRTEVLWTIKEWLTFGGGAQDVLDDAQLYNAIQTFLENPADHHIFQSPNSGTPSVQQAWESLLDTRRQVQQTFVAQTMRPTISRGVHQQQRLRGARASRNVGAREPPDLDRMDPEDFVENLDGMACAAFSNVTEEDLYITADLMEVQTSDRTGWFLSRDPVSTEELAEIQTIYSVIQEIEPSSLISELSQDALYRLLPPGVRSCIRAYSIIRKWLISKIVAPRLGLRARQARIELLIQAIEVARLRNSETPSNSQQTMDQPVESRMHHRAWQSVAMSRGSACDSLASLIQRPYVRTTTSRDCLTVDMGWLLERMLEVIAGPDVMEASVQEGQSRINFDKRRYICNIVSKASILPSARKNPQSEEGNRRGFERLNNIEKEVLNLQFDHRGIKDEAAREAANPGMNGASSSKKTIRPFSKIVALQVEKNRRDKNLRTRLQREKQQEQAKSEHKNEILNKAMRPRKPLSNIQKQHRNKKSVSAFLNFMRPISSAFGADISQPLAMKRTPAELDFPTNTKPSLVLSVLDAQVAQFINNERSYTFQLDTEDGGHYLLQAINKREMFKWLDNISRVTKMAAKRRLTYLGNSPTPQISDHIHHHPITASRDPKAVFGVELEYLLRRETGAESADSVPQGTVPIIIEQCLNEIETRGLNEVGIYRIAGAATEINALKDAYNRGESPLRPTTDIHAICDLVKSWFRVLPEPVFPPASYREVMDAMRLENLDERLSNIRRVVQSLPQANFDILRRVSEHLDRVTDFEEHNHMTAEALAIVFSPNLLRAPQNDFVLILNNMGLSHKLVKALITHFHVIFDESDPEADAHSDEDLESPILEEDEEENAEFDSNHDIYHENHDESTSNDGNPHYDTPR
ncbi:hypothetical protein CVT24_006459 [Panaeolus cyanescens]|uniref:Rho-GAP domain-containing protein n=1 Tax=Panaeolus cyanescens TaxID=181874 RepID=A0A409VZC0_9AGAR|nr:hypothetical protein CVT24_006459 [Panaeolus cyanescens]